MLACLFVCLFRRDLTVMRVCFTAVPMAPPRNYPESYSFPMSLPSDHRHVGRGFTNVDCSLHLTHLPADGALFKTLNLLTRIGVDTHLVQSLSFVPTPDGDVTGVVTCWSPGACDEVVKRLSMRSSGSVTGGVAGGAVDSGAVKNPGASPNGASPNGASPAGAFDTPLPSQM